MQRSTIIGMMVGALSLLLAGDSVFAQLHDNSPRDPTPRSNVGGYTGEALRRIYRTDIGQGFTIASQNRLALARSQANVPYVGQSSSAYGAERLNLGISSPRADKPFANVTSRPTVSPYLNLFREDFDGSSDFNYQTLVRPQLQQQQLNQQLQDQTQALSRRVQQISAQPDYNPAGSRSQTPTGHQTVFGYYGRFYPSLSSGRRR